MYTYIALHLWFTYILHLLLDADFLPLRQNNGTTIKSEDFEILKTVQ